MRLFQLLDDKLPATVKFFHWGDLDLGGLRIMARMQEHLRRALHPHLMTGELLEQHGRCSSRIDTMKLAALASRHHHLKPLVDLVLSFDPPRWLEQENVDPRVPEPL